MKRRQFASLTLAAAFLTGPAFAHDCAGRIDDFERVLDMAAEEAISASSGGQAVAGAREAQAMEENGETEDDPVPFQEEPEAEEAVEEADDAGDGGGEIVAARTELQEARDLAESGDEDACLEAVDKVILSLLKI